MLILLHEIGGFVEVKTPKKLLDSGFYVPF